MSGSLFRTHPHQSPVTAACRRELSGGIESLPGAKHEPRSHPLCLLFQQKIGYDPSRLAEILCNAPKLSGIRVQVRVKICVLNRSKLPDV
jgi:hypothetical protein